MIDPHSLTELLERLEKAEGPDREIDGRVWTAVNGHIFVQWDGAGCVYRTSKNAGISHRQDDQVPS